MLYHCYRVISIACNISIEILLKIKIVRPRHQNFLLCKSFSKKEIRVCFFFPAHDVFIPLNFFQPVTNHFGHVLIFKLYLYHLKLAEGYPTLYLKLVNEFCFLEDQKNTFYNFELGGVSSAEK